MVEAAFRESLSFHLAKRLWDCLLKLMRGSFFVRLCSESAVFRFLGARLPLVSGIGVALLFVVPHNYFNNMYSLVLLIALNVLLFLEIVSGRYERYTPYRMDCYALLFVVMLFVSTLFSASPVMSLRFFLFFLTAFLAFWLCGTILRSQRDFLQFLLPLLVSALIAGLFGCYQRVVGVPLHAWQVDASQMNLISMRVYGFYENPNTFATMILLTMPFFFALFFLGRTRYHKLAVCLCTLPSALSLILTYSRSGWMALCVGIALFFFLTYRFVVPVLCVLGVALMPVLPASIRERIISSFTGKDSSILYRTTLREAMLPALREHWLSGMGLGCDTTRTVIAAYHQAEAARAVTVIHVHNIFFQLWAEMGILGAASFVGMMTGMLRRSLQGIWNAPRRKKFFAAAGLGAIAGALVMGYGDYIWFYPRALLLFWIVAALTLSAVRFSAEEA